jgi:hypothetical protein
MTKTPDTSPYVRTPTVKDRHRLPMQCVVRATPKHEWKPALLVDIFAHSSHNFAVVPSDSPPAGIKAGKVQVEMYKECLIRNKAPTTRPATAESIVDPPPKPSPKFKQGERVVCGPPEDVVYIRAIHTFDEVHGWKYAIDRYSDTNISKLIDQADHIPEDIIQPYIPDNVPPPKFGLGDPVYYDCTNGPTFYIQSSIHTSSGWLYKMINIKTNGTIHCQLTDIPEAELTLAENKVNVLDLPPTPQENNTVVNEQGGKQSHLDARFDCIPPVVLRLLAQCLGFGARKYGKENWKNIPQWDHLNHAVNHINEWNRGNRDEPHLVNAMARLTFALWQAVDTNQQPDTYQHPDQLK